MQQAAARARLAAALPLAGRLAAILALLLAISMDFVWLRDLEPAQTVLSTHLAHPAAIADLQSGDFTIFRLVLLGMQDVAAWMPITMLMLWHATVSLLFIISLLLLTRRNLTEPNRYFAYSNACLCLGIVYLWIFSVVPALAARQPVSLGLRLALDIAAFELSFLGVLLGQRFWLSFPRPVTEAELLGFERDLWERRSLFWRAIGGFPLHRPPATSRHPRSRYLLPAVLLACGAVFLRLSSIVPSLAAAFYLSWIPFVAWFYLMAWSLMCISRLWRFHMARGNEDDRRKLGWLRAVQVLTLFVFMLLCVLFLLLAAYGHALGGSSAAGFAASILLLTFPMAAFVALLVGPLLMTYRGDLDPQLAIRGFTVWTVMGVILTLLFALVERSVALRLAGLLGLPPQTGFVVAGAVIAATFQPIRRRVEKHVNGFVERILPASLLAQGTARTGAIALVDISGYTALAARDEVAARLASALVQKEARQLADRFDGRVVKNTGDGVLMCFTQAQAALDALTALHAAIAASARAVSLPELRLHSGLHWGEFVEVHDGDIYGQSVNLTARIADWAKAGEIGASETFCLQLAGAASGFEPMGPQSFKNVPQPVACLKLTAA